MSREEVYGKLNKLFAELFENESIRLNDNTEAKDVDGWDSLMHISLMSAIENEFGVSFSTKDIVNMKNVGDLVNIIEERHNV